LFDDSADHYATDREKTPYFRAQLAIVMAMLANETGTILVVGCAAGGELPELRARKFDIVGIDLSPRMLGFARTRFAGDPGVRFCRADIECLPFADGSFDHVICLGVFEFLPDYGRSLAEIYRVMRSGGLAIFAIPSRISLYNVTDLLVKKTIRPLWVPAKRILFHAEPSSSVPAVRRNLCVPWSFRRLLKQHGFDPARDGYSNFFIYPLDRFPPLDERIAAVLEPLCWVPVLRCAASVYLVAARKRLTAPGPGRADGQG
jgi:SAM-dependent methyltransferase